MPNWLVQSPDTSYTYAVLGLVALALAYGWWTRRQRKFLIGLAVVAGLLVLVALLDHLVESDQEQIEATLQSMTRDTVAKKLDPVFDHVASEFSYQGMDKTVFKELANRLVHGHDVTSIKVWDFDFPEISRQKKIAKVHFMVKVQDQYFYRCHAEFVLEPDKRWRLKTFQLSNPVVETNQPISIPLN